MEDVRLTPELAKTLRPGTKVKLSIGHASLDGKVFTFQGIEQDIDDGEDDFFLITEEEEGRGWYVQRFLVNLNDKRRRPRNYKGRK